MFFECSNLVVEANCLTLKAGEDSQTMMSILTQAEGNQL
jgi:hypothetical protein